MVIQLWIIVLVTIVCSIISFIRYSNYGRGLLWLQNMEFGARKLKQIRKKTRESFMIVSIGNFVSITALSSIVNQISDQSIVNFLTVSIKMRIALIVVPLYIILVYRETKPIKIFFITVGHYGTILITASILLGLFS
ncbi:MAG TPA: hypothetical protein PKC14_01880 [Candidatus Absconditabacterales bacterium]|nr:hypothetical protein [Candidatus Absconditabacterales bacterium]